MKLFIIGFIFMFVLSACSSKGKKDSVVIDRLRYKIEATNRSLPAPINETTTLTSMMLIDKCVTARYRIEINLSEEDISFLKSDNYKTAFKKKCINNLRASNIMPLLNSFEKEGISMKHILFDKEGNLVTLIEIKPNEFVN